MRSTHLLKNIQMSFPNIYNLTLNIMRAETSIRFFPRKSLTCTSRIFWGPFALIEQKKSAKSNSSHSQILIDGFQFEANFRESGIHIQSKWNETHVQLGGQWHEISGKIAQNVANNVAWPMFNVHVWQSKKVKEKQIICIKSDWSRTMLKCILLHRRW